MMCENCGDLISDYVDGTRAAERPGDARRAAFESHLAGCARCQAVVADLTSIRRAASMLEEHVPPARLWTKIAAAVEEKPRRVYVPMPFALAASVAMLIAAGAWFSWNHAPAARVPQQSVATTDDDTSVPRPEAQYEQAIAGLQQLADTRNAAVDPGTRAVLQQNLAAIDRAIDESRAALADEPASALAQESLLDALDTKVALLQDTVALAAEDMNQ